MERLKRKNAFGSNKKNNKIKYNILSNLQLISLILSKNV